MSVSLNPKASMLARTPWILALAFLMASGIQAQIPEEASLQGYYHRNDTTYFVFDAARYGVEALERVVVTGAFRNWDFDMDGYAWRLGPVSLDRRLWVLPVPNPEYRIIPPATPFKFRINDGTWLEPPAEAPNRQAGNLVFLYGVEPPRLRAEVHGPLAVWATLTGKAVRPLTPSAYRLVDAHGTEAPLAAILPNTATETLIVPTSALDVRRVYYLEIPALQLRARCRFDGWFRTHYAADELGAHVSEDGTQTRFRLFAPRADSVRLYLYEEAEAPPDAATQVVMMNLNASGAWETVVAGDLHGTYYDFTVHGPDDPGAFFYEAFPVHISDPYARVNVDAQGKSRVWRRTRPAPPLAAGRPKMEDVIAYEVHVQDFTDRLPVSDDLKGTIPAMVMPGLRNSRGEPIGFDYLVGLGINVVHLMPVQEFLHYRDDEWQAAFRDDPFMIEQGIHLENYQWGYRTTHAFAIETRYRRGGTEHGAQRDQFRDLVQAFHDRGIAVIVDLVPNHTGENMDGRHYLFNFNVLDKLYYYRTDESGEHIGPFGNEVKTEDRPMVQRWIVDQCKHLLEEFGLDGFRIDLAGQIDEQTLIRLRAELGDDVILYGEPWIDASDPDVQANPDWDWYKEDAPITFFQDAARDAFIGSPFRLENKTTDRGYAGGNPALRAEAMRALTNNYPEEAASPNQGIQYIDIHDNWTLADRFATTAWDGRQGVDAGPYKVAAGLLFTSLGPLVLHGGSEMMRSKGAAPHAVFDKETASGPIYVKGRDDTYNLRRPNQFVWENVGKTDGPNDYANMTAYWKGLIAFRKSTFGEVFRLGEAPPEDYYRWILPGDAHLLGYLVAGRVLVLVNVGDQTASFEDVSLPEGRWRLIADAEAVDPVEGVPGPDAMLRGGQDHTLTVPPTSLKIWIRD